MIKDSLLTLSVFFLVPAISFAELFTNDEYGYSIEVDEQFQITRNDSATFFKSSQGESAIVIKNWSGLDQVTAKNYLQQGYQDSHIAMVPDGELEEVSITDGKGFLIDVKGVIDVQSMKGKVGGFVGNGGQGMIVLFAVPEESWDAMAPAIEQMLASINFVELRAGPSVRDWFYMLAGSRLIHRGVVDGRSQREYLNLCSGGDFIHRRLSSAARDSDSGSTFGHSAGSRSGLWEVVDHDGVTRLVLQYNDGRNESAAIELVGGQIYLDGRRYTRLRKSSCR